MFILVRNKIEMLQKIKIKRFAPSFQVVYNFYNFKRTVEGNYKLCKATASPGPWIVNL